MDAAFLLQYNHVFEINSTPTAGVGAETYLRIAAGISNVTPSNNEEIDQTAYYDGGGNSESDVIGLQKTITFSGHRKYGDPAQDYIMGLASTLGPDRKTTFKWTFPDGMILEGPVTVANITEPGGEANNKGEIEFEIHFAGAPTVTPAPVIP